ncbi:Arm DNA-binding domain-containing protein [Massilia timonae]|uniref:Arm DNA-binding domain-containing protein n=1 Tax=Massilia timonae TaxID=47229 RepID=UPI0028AE99AC|nr:Arm DNA-binding domain-containing protein [Massilia timonae]
MAKVNFTTGRIESYQCETGASQSFLWDSTAPGLGLRATASGAKSFIFQAKIAGKAVRITIGSPATWGISAARAEARKLKVLIDSGHDPRQVRADALAKRQAAQVEGEAAAMRDSITLAEVWKLYVAERLPHWGERHAADHAKMIAPGGLPRTRAKKKVTEAAPLAALINLRLVDLTPQSIEIWAKTEATRRPTSARLALRMLKACLNWCAGHPTLATIVTINAAQSRKARETLGRPKVKDDVLQREQLRAWFSAVKQLPNPVTAAYLQCLLLSGARREGNPPIFRAR